MIILDGFFWMILMRFFDHWILYGLVIHAGRN